MNILLTGGLGFIGSHTCVELLEADYQVIIIDNLSNASLNVLDSIETITKKTVKFYQADVRNEGDLKTIFTENSIDGVIHFAGLKAVGESVAQPLEYYDNNISSTITLLNVMQQFACKTFIFSSSATVYGNPQTLPIKENFPISATNPYGQSKLMIEQILQDLFIADDSWQIGILRYFNPVGAHFSGLIGECPKGVPNNLMPYIAQVAAGKLDKLQLFGNDYNTKDGTGVRDYIHIVDLAIGHLNMLQYLHNKKTIVVINLGTGKGYSVLEIVSAFEKISGKQVPYEIVDRRPGDIDACYADCSYAQTVLGWHAMHGLEQMCIDAWRWQINNYCGS